jgi:hypothetical protein
MVLSGIKCHNYTDILFIDIYGFLLVKEKILNLGWATFLSQFQTFFMRMSHMKIL